jgi:Conjugative transposon protein TcpC
VPSGSFQALSATTLSATPLAERYWSVLVAVDQVQRVVDPDSRQASWQADGTHYYRLGVYGADGHYVATGAPGEVARPNPADAPSALVTAMATPDAGDARTDRVQRFLAAFLTGQGALEDSIAPGLSAAPIDPPPYAQVELRAVGYSVPPTSSQATARATVAATTPSGNVEMLSYALQLVRRDGRWYVAGLDGAAALKPTKSNR